jgi:hypothetical protein
MIVGQRLWLGDSVVISVEEEGFDGAAELPEGFRAALLSALKTMLNKALDFSGAVTAVKRDLLDAEPVRLKTAGLAWSYQFVRVAAPSRVMLFGNEGAYNEVAVLPCKLVLRCHAKAKRQLQ